MLLKMGHSADELGRPLISITFKDYLNRINPPDATRHMLAAWWTTSGSGAQQGTPKNHSPAHGDVCFKPWLIAVLFMA